MRSGQVTAFQLLRFGAIDLEDAHAFVRIRIAQREGVETGAEHDHLAHAAGNGLGETVFGEAAACGDKAAKPGELR